MADSSDSWSERVGELVVRPEFLAAVALLAVNDHILKAAQAPPGWLTGKLSDVAGLFFFPVLLAVVVTALASPDTRKGFQRIAGGAALATAGAFSVLNLFPGVTRLLDPVWGVYTVDPTDLLTLPACAAGYAWMMRHTRNVKARRSRRAVRFAAVALAATASLATSPPPEGDTGSVDAGADADADQVGDALDTADADTSEEPSDATDGGEASDTVDGADGENADSQPGRDANDAETSD